MADPSTNSVVLYGTPAEARAMEEILKNLDVPAKQVSLEAKIVAISKDASQDLGVEWSWQSHRQPLERSWRQRWEQESYIKDPSSSTIRYGIGPGVLGYNVYLDAKVDALVTSGKAKLLSRPNITTLQGHEAVIEIGGEVPVPEQTTANNITTNSIKYRKAGESHPDSADALAQIDDRGYLIPYATSNKPVVKVGVVFSEEARTIDEDWRIAEVGH